MLNAALSAILCSLPEAFTIGHGNRRMLADPQRATTDRKGMVVLSTRDKALAQQWANRRPDTDGSCGPWMYLRWDSLLLLTADNMFTRPEYAEALTEDMRRWQTFVDAARCNTPKLEVETVR